MKDIQPQSRKAIWFSETVGVILIHDNLNNFKKCQSIECCANGTAELQNIKEHPRDVGRAGDKSQERCWTAWLLENRRINKTIRVNSDPCLGSQITTSNLDNTKHSLCCNTFWGPCFEKSSSLQQMTKEQIGKLIKATVNENFGDIYLKNAVTWKDNAKDHRYDLLARHELAMKILRSKVRIKSNNRHIERFMSNSIVEAPENRVMQLHRQSFSTPKILFGPYAQTHVVYNVKEQANAPVREQGTSQQFKQRSQGIGSASISVNDSSSVPSKRRTIKIESGVSFSVEFTDRGKNSGSETSTLTPATDTTTKEKGKKELHRCLCTLSFPTADKKLKNKPCDSGVCVPGICTPSECFKRLQEKYGSKKKSASDVSSSQASQTSKKLERAGKETIVKEKGSSSISKYQKITEVKPLPEKPEFDIFKTAKDCCDKYCKTILDKIQFWKKDKEIELKPTVIGTDISVKDKNKKLGSNAATQSGKITGGAGKDSKGAAGDKKATKKSKKEKKEEKKEHKKEKKAKKAEKKENKTKKEEKKEKKVKKEEKKEKKVKKEEKKEKKAEKEDKKAATKAPKRSGKKGEKSGTVVQPCVEGGDVKSKKQSAYAGIQFFQTTDNDTMTQGVKIGSECACSIEYIPIR